MRIRTLTVSGFRGFATRQSFDLDASTIILSGVNGQGKTSLFDAILWGLSGRVPRVGPDDSRLLSLYSESGEMNVSLEITQDEDHFRVARSFDGESQALTLERGETVTRGSEAQGELLRLLWPPALATEREGDALSSAITRGVYLQQDVVRQFVESDDDQQRFNAISELVGTGRVTELQLALERARTNWTRATNQRIKDNADVFSRLDKVQSEIDRLDAEGSPTAEIESGWEDWWERARSLGLTATPPPAAGSNEAPRSLDMGIKQLDALRQSVDRKAHALRALLEDSRNLPAPPTADTSTLEDQERLLREEVSGLRGSLEEARRVAAELRRRQIELQEKEAELRTLAEIALRHLDDRCPVCAQEIDRAATEERLTRLVRGGSESTSQPDGEESVAKLSEAVENSEKRLASFVSELEAARSAIRDHEAKTAAIRDRLQDLGFAHDDQGTLEPKLESAIEEHAAREQDLSLLAREGEQLGLRLAQARERARRTELLKLLESLQKEAEELRAEERSRQITGELAGEILDGLREAGVGLVQKELERIEPLFQRAYAAIEPHPTFRAVGLLSTVTRGRGRLATQVQDTSAGIGSMSPSEILSSSQMNVLAVSIFLAFNLGFGSLPLQSALLDDPLQSLDDINLLGLVDLLRRVSERRQLIVSTHDSRFSRLLERKLRPVGENRRTVVISFDGWGRSGPITSQRDVALDDQPLRLAV